MTLQVREGGLWKALFFRNRRVIKVVVSTQKTNLLIVSVLLGLAGGQRRQGLLVD